MLAETIQTLTDRARKTLSEQRLLHLLGVTHTIMALAERHGLGVDRAAVAGLLHDLSKQTEPEELERDLKGWGVAVPTVDRDHPRTWHGLHAAVWARRKLALDDEETLEAVTLHTTADAGVCRLTQALFIADFTEPLRKIQEAPDILEAALEDLSEGFRRALRVKVLHLLAKGRPLHPRAERAWGVWLPGEPLVSPVSTGE